MVHVNLEAAFVLLLVGALVAGCMRRWSSAGWVAVVFVGIATVLAWSDGLRVLLSGQTLHSFIALLPMFGSRLAVSLDPLGAGFLLLITAVCLVSTIYSVGYMESYKSASPGRFYSLLLLFIAGMMGVVAVSDWLFFIVFWELMTLASYFLVTFERADPQVLRAGFKYFIMTHVATAGLLVAAVVLWSSTGSFAFAAHSSGLAAMVPTMRNLLLALYLLAFATKAGIFPMGDWLPDAHPAAPSGVSAILSGVMIKLGAYGVLRVFWGTLPQIGIRSEVLTWGTIIAFLGVLSAFVGGVTAMKENDAKRLLAFSSISQAGYIFLALGIAIAFSTTPGLHSIAVIALIGAGCHILNDGIFKALLFMNAGSLVYSTGVRDLNKLGGLASVMPLAAVAGLIGIVSVSGLPPTSGFVSKWLIYQSAISGGMHFAPFVALAVVAFFVSLCTLAYSVKYFNSAFLGKPASGSTPTAIPRTMTVAQCVLALACIVLGLSPVWIVKSVASVFHVSISQLFQVRGVSGLATIPADGVVSAYWIPLALIGAFVVCFLVAEAIRNAGKSKMRIVPSWYGGEEHCDDEVRFRAQGLYSPFNEAFAKVYPHVPVPRLPSLEGLRGMLSLDRWLYDPIVRIGGVLVDKISRSHVGVPQLYMVWQIAGMILALVVLFMLIR